jgi:hypothetical protein
MLPEERDEFLRDRAARREDARARAESDSRVQEAEARARAAEAAAREAESASAGIPMGYGYPPYAVAVVGGVTRSGRARHQPVGRHERPQPHCSGGSSESSRPPELKH